MAEIREFCSGYCRHPEFIALKKGKFRIKSFPAKFWLINTSGKHWLFDTGYSERFMEATDKGIFKLYRMITPVEFTSGNSAVNQLAACGIPASDINGVILSHFHGDHTGGLKDFSCSVVCSLKAWEKVKRLKGLSALKNAFIPSLIGDDFEKNAVFMENLRRVDLSDELAPCNTGYELPGSGGEIVLVELAGHAGGHIGAFVKTDDGWVFLAGDAAWDEKAYVERLKPTLAASFLMASRKDYINTINKLHTLWKNGVRIKLSHGEDI